MCSLPGVVGKETGGRWAVALMLPGPAFQAWNREGHDPGLGPGLVQGWPRAGNLEPWQG